MADPAVLAASTTTMWAFMSAWFTPTSLFLLLNLMIGTIVISSRFHQSSDNHPAPADDTGHHHQPDHRHSSGWAPSLLDRVPSINSFAHKFNYGHLPDPAPTIIQRLKSINFAHYVFDHPAPVSEHEPEHAPAPARAPSLLHRLKSVKFSPYRHSSPEPVSEPRPAPARTGPPPMAPVPSFLERVKSINFSLYGQDDLDLADHFDHHMERANSDMKPRGGEPPEKLPAKMRKSASHRSAFAHFRAEEAEEEEAAAAELRRPETAAAELRRPEPPREQGRKKGQQVAPITEEGAGEIDAKADDFINRFKAQLKLQRLDSIIRYKDMLTRGAS